MPVLSTEGRMEIVVDAELISSTQQHHQETIVMSIDPEQLLAQALLMIEPEKFVGGTPERRAWLGAITEIMVVLHGSGYDLKRFADRLMRDNIVPDLDKTILEETL